MMFNTSGPVPPPIHTLLKRIIQFNLREELLSDFSSNRIPHNTALTSNLKNLSKNTVHLSTTQFTWERKTFTNKKSKSRINNSKMSTQDSENNGSKKASNSLMTISKMQSTEQLPNNLGTTSSKDLMKTNHFGSKTRPKSASQNIDNSIKTFSRIPAIHWHGHISRLKVMSILQAWCTFLKELHMISFKSFMKGKTKSNFLSEEFW